MQKVGIVTFHRAYNVGSMLQAYALKEAIASLNYSPVFVNYIPPAMRLPWYRPGIRSRAFPANVIYGRKYRAFQRENFVESPEYKTADEFRAALSDYHALVTGSDQVWNYFMLRGVDPVYSLDTGTDAGPLRISYAACFGQPDQSLAHMAQARVQLEKMNSISVRNEMSASLVKELVGIEPVRVTDPTFLFDFTEKAGKPIRPGKYVFVYCLDRGNISEVTRIAQEVAKDIGGEVVVFANTFKFPGDVVQYRCGAVDEWLSLLKHASCVVSDSFHGTVFSLKFQKPFVVSVRQAWRSHRIVDLLNHYGLAERILPLGCSAVARFKEPIAYEAVEAKIAEDVKHSREFLRCALIGQQQ